MANQPDTVSVRVAVTGTEEGKAALQSLGDEGDKQLGRVGTAADKASAQLTASLARWTSNVDPAARAQAQLAKGQDVFNQSLAAGLITQTEHARLLDQLKSRYDAARSPIEATTRAVAGSHGSIATATREFRALFDELSSGRTRQTPGTLAIIATRVLGLSPAAIGAAVAIAGIPAAFLLAANAADTAVKRIDAALKSTGNAAGVTTSQVVGIANNLDANTKLSTAGARSALTTLVGTGRIGADLLEPAAGAIPGYASATGVKSDEAAKQIAAMLAEPAKGAKELADRFNALDAAQLREVDNLVAQGRTQDAQRIVLDALTGRFQGLENSTGSLSQRFSSLEKSASDFFTRLGDAGRPQTLQEQRDAVASRLADEQKRQTRINDVQSPGVFDPIGGITRGVGPFGFLQSTVDQNAAAVAADKQTLATLNEKLASEQLEAQQKAQEAQQNRLIEQATALSAGFDTVDAKTQKVTNASQSLSRGLAAARAELASLLQFQDSNEDPAAAERIKALQDLIAQIQKAKAGTAIAATHQLDPATEAARELSDQGAALRSPIRDRERLRQQSEIEKQYRDALANPQTAAGAGSLRAQRQSNFSQTEANKDSDPAAKLGAETEGELALAKAYDQSTAAGERQKIVNEAHAAYLSGAINDEARYTQELLARASATERASSASTIANQRLANEQGQRLATASGQSPAAEAEARRVNEAMSATQKERDTATTPDAQAAAQQHLQQLEEEYRLRDQIGQQIRSNDEGRQLEQTLQEKQTELALMGQNAELRAKELADLKLRNELINEGYEVGTQAFDSELAKRQQISEQIAQTDVQLQRINNADRDWQQLSADFSRVVSTNFETALAKGKDLRSVLKGLEQDLVQLITRIAVTKPLENALTELLTGKPTGSGSSAGVSGGGLFTMLASKLGGSLFGGSTGVTTDNGVSIGGFFGAGGTADDLISGAPGDTGNYGSADEFGDALGAGFDFAHGGVFDDGALMWGGTRGVRRFAGGGVFGTDSYRARVRRPSLARPAHLSRAKRFAMGSVFSSPAYFQYMSGGTPAMGQMGEAGPEAAMPLTTMPGGHLGVRATGAGNQTNHYYDLRGADSSAVPQLKALLARVNAIDSSIEGRAIAANAGAARRDPRLYAARR